MAPNAGGESVRVTSVFFNIVCLLANLWVDLDEFGPHEQIITGMVDMFAV